MTDETWELDSYIVNDTWCCSLKQIFLSTDNYFTEEDVKTFIRNLWYDNPPGFSDEEMKLIDYNALWLEWIEEAKELKSNGYN